MNSAELFFGDRVQVVLMQQQIAGHIKEITFVAKVTKVLDDGRAEVTAEDTDSVIQVDAAAITRKLKFGEPGDVGHGDQD